MSDARPVRGPARFRERDVVRAIKGALAAASKDVVRVEVEVDGITIRVVLADDASVPSSGNSLDRWREKRRAG